MKNLFLIVLFIAGTALGQTYVDEKPVVNNTSLQSTNSQLNLATTQNQSTSSQFVNQNTVFIEQVGSNNSAMASISSNDSQVVIFQDGTNNTTDLNLSADRIRNNIVQIGNSNQVFDYSTHGAQVHEATVLQNGNYNTTISVGANSISERMQINQTGNGSSVFVLHF